MRGPVNTPIALTILRKGRDEPFEMKIVRDVIRIRVGGQQIFQRGAVLGARRRSNRRIELRLQGDVDGVGVWPLRRQRPRVDPHPLQHALQREGGVGLDGIRGPGNAALRVRQVAAIFRDHRLVQPGRHQVDHVHA